MFKSKTKVQNPTNQRISDFAFISESDVYTDTACQSLRPLVVQQSLQDYYTKYNACGGRVKYAWGQKVDESVEETRNKVLNFLDLPKNEYVVSFTTNTTYGINLLLQQLPKNIFKKIITSDLEHNSVFLPTMSAAKALGIPRQIIERQPDGSLVYNDQDFKNSLVVLNTVSNIDARQLSNVAQIVKDVHNAGGKIILDAAQTMAHSHELIKGLKADAVCFSSHKMYGPSLGVIVIKKDFLLNLDTHFIGGGMVHSVQADSYELLPDDLSSRLEPGLQAFGEIIAFGAALDWLKTVKPFGKKPHDYILELSKQLYDGLSNISGVHVINKSVTPVISVYSDKYDAHRLAIFLSGAGIMSRSGSFCCHYYLLKKTNSPPLLRFSLGLHNTKQDVEKVLKTMRTLTESKA